MNPHTILVADDDESLRRIIEFNLNKRGYRTTSVESGEKALKALEKSDFDLLISDVKMPGLDGIELMQEARKIDPELMVIFITAFGTVEKAVEAMKLGAYDYITKPFDKDDFLQTVEKALEYRRLQDENLRLRSELEKQYSFSNIIGTSKVMQAVFATIRKIANTDATVLITGKSGTGKELIAKAIHQGSDRSKGPMVTVNCAAIPKELLESELFGHVAGAFTGAIKDKTGKFVAANGGTIFLDEIGDMSMELQAKLLRVLEDRTVEPVGSERGTPVDIRVLAATNQDLRNKVKKGQFREDLFYRLHVIPLYIPSLQERPGDIPLLIDHFLKQFSGGKQVSIDKKALEILTSYSWSGNVRELENLIKRMVILKRGKVIRATDLPPEILKGEPEGPETETSAKTASSTSLIESEIGLITEALKSSGWNQSRAAKHLGIPRHVLIYRMKKHNIKEEQS